MTNLDAIQTEPFGFTLGGKDYSIPALDSLDADLVLDLISKDDVSMGDVMALFRATLDKHAPEALERMRLDQLKALLRDWMGTGNVGESSTSSD